MNETFLRQAQLLVQVLPIVHSQEIFALKGGTAINLFVRDLPRLSVDIDLTYLPLDSRTLALKGIDGGLRAINKGLKQRFRGIQVHSQFSASGKQTVRLRVSQPGALVKIEPNQIIRGSVLPPEDRHLSPNAEEIFGMSSTARLLNFAELYGGKICAALDRQHPRDLFDVHILLQNEGITDQVRQCFIVHLASHNRPMSELLSPRRKRLQQIFERDFAGMTDRPVTVQNLQEARELLVRILREGLTPDEKAFLLSLKHGEPEWHRLPFENLDKLPAIQWKLQNIRKMETAVRKRAIEKLSQALAE